MNALQEFATQWLTSLSALPPVGFAFGAGIVAAVNPRGFAMLPAYLSLYLGNQRRASRNGSRWDALRGRSLSGAWSRWGLSSSSGRRA